MQMLIPREELRYDFGAARFDVSRADDRKLLAWVFNQFLYGEVTGIQCGHWLYRAPTLGAASFLARQAGEEISHVKRVLRILTILGEKPAPAHGAIRFLSTGMMGGSWGEHVTLEMALGEGLVLGVFYALAETIDHPEIRKILETAAVDEERHCAFGERESVEWLRANPGTRSALLAQATLQVVALSWLKRFMMKRLLAGENAAHPVLRRFPAFYDHSIRMFSVRAQRLGLCDRPIHELPGTTQLALLARLPLDWIAGKLKRKPPLLTTTYLADPVVTVESAHRDKPETN